MIGENDHCSGQIQVKGGQDLGTSQQLRLFKEDDMGGKKQDLLRVPTQYLGPNQRPVVADVNPSSSPLIATTVMPICHLQTTIKPVCLVPCLSCLIPHPWILCLSSCLAVSWFPSATSLTAMGLCRSDVWDLAIHAELLKLLADCGLLGKRHSNGV